MVWKKYYAYIDLKHNPIAMRAVMLGEPFRLEMMDIPKPVPRSDEVLIRVKAVGICGSDVRYFHGENPWALHTIGKDLKETKSFILGHEAIRLDIVEARDKMKQVIPNASRTFAYPCYQTSIGRGLSKKSYVPIVAEIFLAAKAFGERGYSNAPLACDLHELWSWPADHMRFEEMTGLTIKAVYEDRWAIFTFHGINEGHLPVSDHDLTGFLKFLDDYRKKIWVAPLVEVAEFIIEERKRLNLVP